MSYSKKQAGIIILCICLIGALLCGAGYLQYKREADAKNAARKQYEVTYSPEDTYTVCIYLSASGMEEEGLGAASWLLECIQSAKLPKGIKVLTETGGADFWNNKKMEGGAYRRFMSDSKNRMKLMEELEPRNMAESDTLADFLTWCGETAPADHQILIIWGHGKGSGGGLIAQNKYEDVLTLRELRSALEKAYPDWQNETPLEMTALMTCLGQNIDTAAVLSGMSSYYVASEEVYTTNLWKFDQWLDDISYFRGMDGRALGMSLCDALADNPDVGSCYALSALDLEKAPRLLSAYEKMGLELTDKISADPGIVKKLRDTAWSSENYGFNEQRTDEFYNMADLGDFCRNAEGWLPSAKEVREALSECVVYLKKGESHSDAEGLSFYYPYKYNVKGLDYYDQDACCRVFAELYKLTERYESNN